jgi:hypothetical protein
LNMNEKNKGNDRRPISPGGKGRRETVCCRFDERMRSRDA